MNQPIPDPAPAKDRLRATLIAARRQRSGADRAAAARANAAHLRTLLAGARTVCGYLPLDSEPLRTDLLDHLVAAGCTVLVPVIAPDAPLDWCTYPSPSAPGAFGIAESVGPRLGPGAASSADAVLVPALAVDRTGARLGRGGGHYDRTLALLSDHHRDRELVAVLFDGELLDVVPTGAHDRAVTSAVQPTGGIHRFRS